VSERGRITIYESVYEGQRREAMKRREPVDFLRGICCWCEEAGRRAALRREAQGLPEPLPVVHPDQTELVAA
jgi:hypothetical protein